ncbi:hypothetical protein [Egbenema bharatensis]|uniref:hypothetical protein n=1 Tax=Egbenema bharatensis TaxID=3463334 RepID=UPI003A879000
MLPTLLTEGNYHSFKFWFNHQIQDGLLYQNELFYRLKTVSASDRMPLYRSACIVARYDSVLVTVSRTEYSMWVSLRSPRLADLLQELAKP